MGCFFLRYGITVMFAGNDANSFVLAIKIELIINLPLTFNYFKRLH